MLKGRRNQSLFLSLVFGSVQLLVGPTRHRGGLGIPPPLWLCSKCKSIHTGEPRAALSERTERPTEALVAPFLQLHSLLLGVFLTNTWCLQDLCGQFLEGALDSIPCLGAGLWEGEKGVLLYLQGLFSSVSREKVSL